MYFELIQAGHEQKHYPWNFGQGPPRRVRGNRWNIEGFQERLRKSFSSSSTILEDLNKTFQHETGGDSAKFIFKKLDKLVKKYIETQIQWRRISSIHCVKDKELKT